MQKTMVAMRLLLALKEPEDLFTLLELMRYGLLILLKSTK